MDDSIYLNEPLDADTSVCKLVNDSLSVWAENDLEAFLVLTALAGQISYEEVFSLYGKNSNKFKNKIVGKLTENKWLAKQRFSKPEGDCYFYYSITAKGCKAAEEIIDGSQYIQRTPFKDGRIGSHAYAIGYNLYQLVRSGIPFRWVKEAPYDNPLREGLSFKTDMSYRTDCNAVFVNSGRVLHIEEDQASENASVILNKIRNYFDKGCFEEPLETLLFSIRSPKANINSPAMSKDNIYSALNCKQLLDCMRENGLDDATALLGVDNIFPKQEYLKRLLLRMDCLGNDSPLGQDELTGFYSTIKKGISPLQQADFNRMHQKESYNLARYLGLYIIRSLDAGREEFFMLKLIQGRCIGLIPTTLLSSRLPYLMLSMFPDTSDLIASALSEYYGYLRFMGEISSLIPYGKFSESVSFRNAFAHGTGTVYVEFPFCDAVSWVRCHILAEHGDVFREEDIHVVFVFEELSDAEGFFISCGYSAKTMDFKEDGFAVYAMLLSDIKKGNAVLYAPCGGGNERIMTQV